MWFNFAKKYRQKRSHVLISKMLSINITMVTSHLVQLVLNAFKHISAFEVTDYFCKKSE